MNAPSTRDEELAALWFVTCTKCIPLVHVTDNADSEESQQFQAERDSAAQQSEEAKISKSSTVSLGWIWNRMKTTEIAQYAPIYSTLYE